MKKQTILTGYDDAVMLVFTEKANKWTMEGDGIAFQVQAMSWKDKKKEDSIHGSLVISWKPNPLAGPHNIITQDDTKCQVVYEVELFDLDTGAAIPWEEAELATMYDFQAKGYTGWIANVQMDEL